MNRQIQMRLGWVKLYQERRDAGFVCRRCGVSRPTLRKWVRRHEKQGIDGLRDQSRRPKRSPNRKVFEEQNALILDLRRSRKLGPRRIQSELKRLHDFSLSMATIHKVLKLNDVKPLRRVRRKKDYIRYQRPIPGDRIQMDTIKIAPRLYQYTAIDDCTRYRVLGLYNRRSAINTLLFLEKVIEETPFPIQRIQTDRGGEFFAFEVQRQLKEYSIKFRPIKPGSPHLNGKVERSQKTDLQEFYETVDTRSEDIEDRLQEWQHYYNWDRPHGSLGGKTPIDKCSELRKITPFSDEVWAMYDPSKERYQEQNYRLDLLLKKLKPSL